MVSAAATNMFIMAIDDEAQRSAADGERNIMVVASAMNHIKQLTLFNSLNALSSGLYNEVLAIVKRVLILSREKKTSFRTCDYEDTNFTNRLYLLVTELQKLGFAVELKHPSSTTPMHIVVSWGLDKVTWMGLVDS